MSPGDTARAIDGELRALGRANTPRIRALRRRWSRELRAAPAKHLLATAFALRERHGHRFVALELVRFHPDALASVRTPQLRRLGRGIDGWAAVDTFGCLVAGHVWRERQVRGESNAL